MIRTPIGSSDIASIGWEETPSDAGFGTMEIEFHATGVYRYFGVPKVLAEDLRKCAFPGKLFLMQVKGRYSWERVGDAEQHPAEVIEDAKPGPEVVRVRREFTREEAMQAASEWMKKEYLDTLKRDPDKYHTMLGLLADFASDLFTNKP